MRKPTWRPLQRAMGGKRNPGIVAEAMRVYDCDEPTAVARLDEYDRESEFWVNDLYQVQVRRFEDGSAHINIRARDGRVILRDWRHFQQIKNEVVGPECEAIELYPAESRKVDTSNKYHLYASSDPTFRFPVGFEKRDVRYEENRSVAGMRQRIDVMGLNDGDDR